MATRFQTLCAEALGYTSTLPAEPVNGVRLSEADAADAKRKARVALRLAVIAMWEHDQSPLAGNR